MISGKVSIMTWNAICRAGPHDGAGMATGRDHQRRPWPFRFGLLRSVRLSSGWWPRSASARSARLRP